MAMDKDRLGIAMSDAMIAASGVTPIALDKTAMETVMIALADEIIKEFIAFAEVTDIVTSTPGATAGQTTLPGTGTGSVTA